MVYTVCTFFVQNISLVKINKEKKAPQNPFNYIVSHYLKQALPVHLQYHVIHVTCPIIEGSGLISIFELIQKITVSFRLFSKKDFVDISIRVLFMLSNIMFCTETLYSYHTMQSRCNLIHFGVLYRNIYVTTAN